MWPCNWDSNTTFIDQCMHTGRWYIPGGWAHNFILNATFDAIEVSKYDGLVIPGGRVPEYLAVNESVIGLVTKFSNSEKPIAAICHGPYCVVKPVLVAAGAHWVEPETGAACLELNVLKFIFPLVLIKWRMFNYSVG